MLTFRLTLVAGTAGICLWGLFSLLDSLAEPAILRNAATSVIKGCELLNNEETRAVCPQLFCQKAVIDTRLVPSKSRFAVTVDKAAGTERLIGGAVSNKEPGDPASSFACLVRGARIVAVRISDRAGLEAVASQEGNWTL